MGWVLLACFRTDLLSRAQPSGERSEGVGFAYQFDLDFVHGEQKNALFFFLLATLTQSYVLRFSKASPQHSSETLRTQRVGGLLTLVRPRHWLYWGNSMLTFMAVCFIVYILANIGLALQNSYAALFVLRCVQSTGSSATIAMCSAVVSDVATAAERGKYMGFTLAGSLLGPAIGPVIGGILADFLGWRAIFWFLTIMGAAFLLVFAIFFPETGMLTFHNCIGPVADLGLCSTQSGRKRLDTAQRVEYVSDELPCCSKSAETSA